MHLLSLSFLLRSTTLPTYHARTAASHHRSPVTRLARNSALALLSAVAALHQIWCLWGGPKAAEIFWKAYCLVPPSVHEEKMVGEAPVLRLRIWTAAPRSEPETGLTHESLAPSIRTSAKLHKHHTRMQPFGLFRKPGWCCLCWK